MAEAEISEEELDEIFRQMADQFIDQANELAKGNGNENVGLAMLYAASRFNAFVVSQHSATLEDYEKDLTPAREFFLAQYERMLDENLEDYKQVYSKYAHLLKKQ
jgi:hypothetical protein